MSEKKKPNNSISDRVKINKIYFYNVVTLKDEPIEEEGMSTFDKLYTRFIVRVPYAVDNVDAFKNFISDWYKSPSSEGNHDIVSWNIIDEEIVATLDNEHTIAVYKV